jgi:sigma-B regulation protein RsbU (phosphoserine phosphatase)
VVIVDDEPSITASLRSFLLLETDYRVHTFQNPLEALEQLPRLGCDILISDFLMPQMDGISFLSRVREFDRDLPLILLTGYADKENAIRAINEVGLFQYVEKPWDNDSLKLILQNGIRQQTLGRALRAKIRELDSVVTRLTSLEARDQLRTSELEMARKIQESLLPDAPPSVPGLRIETHYLPLIEVGGDFFDFHSRDNRRVELLIADVVGHGIQAALITTMVKAVFQECLSRELEPAATLQHLNTRLLELTPDDRFVTAIAASVDVESRLVRIANAGHPRPCLLSASRRRIEHLTEGELPLGILPGSSAPPYQDLELSIDPGDRLLFYTDGLEDLISPSGELFGDRQLGAVLERAMERRARDPGPTVDPSPLGAFVLEEAKRFAEGREPVDDINIVTLEFEG